MQCAVCKSYVVLALLPAQGAVFVSPVLCLHYCQCSVLCVVFALLPAQCAVHVSPVLCLLNVLPAQFAMRGYDKSSYYYFILLFLLFCVCTTASAVCCVCKSYVVFALLPAQGAVCISPVLCLHYCQRRVLCLQVLCCVSTTVSAVCCVCKCCVVFALLPAQCAVCVSPMLCLHYCQRSVLCCVRTTTSAVCCVRKSCVLFAQCTASAVCRAGAMISSLIIILFCYFLLFLPIPTSWEWMSMGFSIITTS